MRQRIDHKTVSLAYKCYEGRAPGYLHELILRYVPSSSQPRLRIPSAAVKHEQFSFRAFSSSGPKLWNALPQTIKEADSSSAFRRRLKSRLFFRKDLLAVHSVSILYLNYCDCLFILYYLYFIQRSEHSG